MPDIPIARGSTGMLFIDFDNCSYDCMVCDCSIPDDTGFYTVVLKLGRMHSKFEEVLCCE